MEKSKFYIEIEFKVKPRRILRAFKFLTVFLLILSWTFLPLAEHLTFSVGDKKMTLSPKVKVAEAAPVTIILNFNQTILTEGTAWTVPDDWTDGDNTIEVIGGGGAGRSDTTTTTGAAGGGGGAYSKSVNQALTPGSTVYYAIGNGGSVAGVNGGDTYFCNSTSNCASIAGSAVIAGAKGGTGATSASANGVGGAAGSGFAYGTGNLKYSGGDGADGHTNSDSGGGGGGGAGPNGNGAAGGPGDTDNATDGVGGGGGGNGGGSVGGSGITSDTVRAAGGNNSSGSGGGAGGGTGDGSSGTNGGGGSGGSDANDGGHGGNGIDIDGSIGSGGGGGGVGDMGSVYGGNGGLYGGGGGGGRYGGRGAPGIIVITYNGNAATRSSWVVPADWNDGNNTIEVIGAGGGGYSAANGAGSAGGGGGAYVKSVNQDLTPGATVSYAIGNGGRKTAVGAGAGLTGGDSYLCNSTSNCASIAGSAVIAGAKGGTGATSVTANGTGGTTAASFAYGTGNVKMVGGAGGDGNSTGDSSGGGGGAAQQGEAGQLGGTSQATSDWGGGGGGGAGDNSGTDSTAGANPASATGGAGGLGRAGTGDAAGTGGGGDGGNDGQSGVNGYSGNEWTSAGAGGGGGGGGDNTSASTKGGDGGLFGGGGGGGAIGGWGSNGIIVITYEPLIVTTIGDGTDPGDSSIAPGASVLDIDNFSLVASSGSDTVTALTVTLGVASSYNNISKVEITDGSNVDECTDIDNPSSVTLNFTGCSLAVTTSPTEFKVRITPKTHANMPAVPGASYAVTATVTSITATNSIAGTDTNSATITVDNASPAGVTSSTATPGNTVVDLAWTNPADADFDEIIILRHTSAISDVPVEGTEYSVGNTIGSATVACNTASTSCQDTSLSNGTPYHYKIFTQDTRGNYNAGTVPTGSPATPVTPTVISGTTNLGNASDVIKVAINGVLDNATGDISAGSWSITPAISPTNGQVVVVFVDGQTDGNESTAISKYDATGNMTGMVLNSGVLTIGSVDAQSLSLTDLDIYSCANDEDVMHSVISNVLNVEGQTCAGSVNNSYSGETLSTLASNTLTVATAETVTTEKILNAGTITATGSPVFNLAGVSGILFDNTGTFTQATSTVNVIGSSGTMTLLSNAETFDKLTINAPSSTVSAGAAVTMASTATSRFYIQNGSFYDSGAQIVGTATGGATMEMASGTTLILGSGTGTSFPTNYTAGQITLNPTSTVAYNATVSQTVSGVPTYGHLEVTSSSGTPTKTLGANTVVAGDLTIDASNTLALSTYNFSVTGPSSITGTLNDASATGTNLFTGMVTINSGGIWTTSNNPAFEFRGGLACDSVAGFTSGAGIYTFSTNVQTISSSGGGTCSITNLTNSITSGNGLTISSAQPTIGTLLQSTNGVLTFSGTVPTITTLTANAGPNTVQYTSGSAQTVKGTTYHHLSKSGAGTATLGGATVLNGNLTISAGGLDLSTLDFTTTGTSSITGTLTDSSATGTNLFTGAVTINSGGIWNNSGNDSFTFRGGFTNDSSSGFTAGSGIYTFDTNVQTISGSQSFTITNLTNNITSSTGLTFSGAQPTVTTLTQGSSAILTFSGTVPSIGTLDASVSTNSVQYTGASQTVKNGTYHDLTISGSSTKTLGGVIDVNNNLLISAGTLSTADHNITIGGNYTNNAVFSAGAGTVIFDAGDTGNTMTGTMTGGSKFNNITFNNVDGAWSFGNNSTEIGGNFSVGAGAVTAPSTTLTIGGNFTNTPATTSSFVHNSGTVVLNTTGTSIVDGNSTFNNLSVTTDNKEVLFGSGDTFTINGALTLTASAHDVRIRIDSSTGHNDQWYINNQGTESIAFIDLKNAGCDASSTSITVDTGSVDSSNNDKDCWIFIVVGRSGGGNSEASSTPDGPVGGGGSSGGSGSEGSDTPDEPVGGGGGGGSGGGDSGFLFKPRLLLVSVPEVFELVHSIFASISHKNP